MYESFSACSTGLHKFQPTNEDAILQKRQLAEDQTRLLSRVEERIAPVAESDMLDIVEENRSLRMMLRKYEEQLQTLESMPSQFESVGTEAIVLQENIRLR